MPEDLVLKVGSSSLQHGPLSQRVYLMHLAPDDADGIVGVMEALACENGYTKLFAKVPARFATPFHGAGFTTEASIPAFYADGDAALFLSRFLHPGRALSQDGELVDGVLATAHSRSGMGVTRHLPANCCLKTMNRNDARRMADLYTRVFDSYPFPIFDPDYLARTMDENFRYFGVECDDELVALASCEMDDGGVEMTDFATAPHWRRAGLGGHLLSAMETEMRSMELQTAFTIARSASYGINILFARAGYAFGGTLVNNTHIAGRLESMNVWYKPLQGRAGD